MFPASNLELFLCFIGVSFPDANYFEDFNFLAFKRLIFRTEGSHRFLLFDFLWRCVDLGQWFVWALPNQFPSIPGITPFSPSADPGPMVPGGAARLLPRAPSETPFQAVGSGGGGPRHQGTVETKGGDRRFF